MLALALIAIGVLSFYHHGRLAHTPVPAGAASLKDYGDQLFTTYLLPVQVTGFLLLVAMLGVTVLSRKFESKEGAP